MTLCPIRLISRSRSDPPGVVLIRFPVLTSITMWGANGLCISCAIIPSMCPVGAWGCFVCVLHSVLRLLVSLSVSTWNTSPFLVFMQRCGAYCSSTSVVIMVLYSILPSYGCCGCLCRWNCGWYCCRGGCLCWNGCTWGSWCWTGPLGQFDVI